MRGMWAILGVSFLQSERGATGRGEWSALGSFPPSRIVTDYPCGNLGKLSKGDRSCETPACLCLLLPGLLHHFKSDYEFTEHP